MFGNGVGRLYKVFHNSHAHVFIIPGVSKKEIKIRKGALCFTGFLIIATAALYGDAVITPAISVLSAYEGLEVVTLVFKPAVVRLTVITLLLLFLFQSGGATPPNKG